ncbi:MAG TPA: serine hydrolase domain-containing protein, partial [Gemmatimonadaceae bacterium]
EVVTTRVDSLAAEFLARTHTPAISVAVLRGSDTLVMKGYGDASVELHRPATASTVYRVGSITKQFTAAAIMRLAERGKLSIDDPISKYLPDVPTHGRTITIRRLLNHTSGIHNYTAEPAWRPTWAQQLSPRQIVAFVDHDSLDFKPGDKWSYSNTNFVLLGMIIEKVTGESYANYLEHDLFKPLGLTQTSYCPSRPSDPTFADGYSIGSGAAKPAEFLDMTHPHGAGAICSTVRDLVKWQRALQGGRVVNAKSYALMTTPDTLNDGKPLTYGFGLATGRLGTHRQIGHNGGINGFTTASFYYPDDSVNVVVFSNADAGPDALALNVSRTVFGIPPVAAPKPVVAVALPDSIRDKLPGIYDLAPPGGGKFVIHIMVENGQVMTQAEGAGQGKFPLIYAGNWVFGASFDPSLRVTFLRESGAVSKMRLEQGGGTMEGPRRP